MGLYVEIMTTVDTSCQTFIQNNVVAIAEGIKDPAFTMLGVYVVFWGVAHMTNTIQEPITDAIKRLLKIVFILGIAFNIAVYNTYIVDTITKGPEQLAALLSASGTDTQVTNTLEKIYSDTWAVGAKFWNNAGVFNGNFGFYIIALLIYGVACALSAYSAFLVILSKVAISVLVALGPLFIVAAMFDTTRRFFESWAGMLCNYGLVTVLVVAINKFILDIFTTYLAQAVTDSGIVVSSAAPVAVTALICFFVLGQVLNIAGGLSKGVALSTMGVGQWIRQQTGFLGGNTAHIIRQSAGAAQHTLTRKVARRFTLHGSIARNR